VVLVINPEVAVMKQKFSAGIWPEGDWYVAQCLEVDIASQGKTPEEALANLREAVELFMECADPQEIARRVHGGARIMEFEIARG